MSKLSEAEAEVETMKRHFAEDERDLTEEIERAEKAEAENKGLREALEKTRCSCRPESILYGEALTCCRCQALKEDKPNIIMGQIGINTEGLKLKDFDVWYLPCENCGYDTAKSTAKSPAKCWRCGQRIKRDFTKRALKKDKP